MERKRKRARLNGEERKGEGRGGCDRTDKAAVSNLVAPLYIQLGKAQTGMERGWGGVRKGWGQGGWKKSGEQGVRAESGGACKATMKAHRLNGSSRFVLIAVRMSRRFPWVIAASVLVKGKAMRPLCWLAPSPFHPTLGETTAKRCAFPATWYFIIQRFVHYSYAIDWF